MRTLMRIHSCHTVTAVAVLVLLTSGRAAAQETILYYTTDAVGSVRMVTDSGGAVVARYDYRPFGDPCGTACGPQGSTEKRQFGGTEKDLETDLNYFGARYYMANAGRFATPDEPGVDQFLSQPQSFGLYTYVRGNPQRYVDDTGQGAVLAFVKLLANARRTGIRRAWAAERELARSGRETLTAFSEEELNELITKGRVRGYEGHHINSVNPGKDIAMASNPDNVRFLTRGDHLAAHEGNWRNPTSGRLVNRTMVAGFLARLDFEERQVTSREWCGSLCSSPDSNWALVNPVNFGLDFLIFLRASVPDLPRPNVTTGICFGTYEQCIP